MAGAGFQVGKGFSIAPASAYPTANNLIMAVTNAAGGTLTSATYYIKYANVYANGEAPNLSNEQTITTSGTNNAFTVYTNTMPTGCIGVNIYVSTVSGQESFYGQITQTGTSGMITVTSIPTGRPFPQWNTTSFIDINLSAVGLGNANEFILHNIYYNNPVAIGVYDSVNNIITMFDGDTGNGARMGLSVHCNNNQWIRVFNQSANTTINVNFDGMQTQ